MPHKTTIVMRSSRQTLNKDLQEVTMNLKQSSGAERRRSKTHNVTRKWHKWAVKADKREGQRKSGVISVLLSR